MDSTFAATAFTSLGKTSSSTFELKRKMPRKMSDAPARIVRNERTMRSRQAATPIATPIEDRAGDQHGRRVDAAPLERLDAEDRAEDARNT